MIIGTIKRYVYQVIVKFLISRLFCRFGQWEKADIVNIYGLEGTIKYLPYYTEQIINLLNRCDFKK